MVHQRSQPLDHTFFALSDPTRRSILSRLAEGDKTIAELAKPLSMSLPGVTKHLRVLEQAGLIKQEKRGRARLCRLIAEPLKEAAEFVETYRQFWETQLDNLAEYLEQTTDDESSTESSEEVSTDNLAPRTKEGKSNDG